MTTPTMREIEEVVRLTNRVPWTRKVLAQNANVPEPKIWKLVNQRKATRETLEAVRGALQKVIG